VLTRYIITMKRWKMKKNVKNAIKICIFLIIANLPFITATQLIGMDTFLDSFENPNYYHCIQGSGISMEPNINDGNYILLQKSSHPKFQVTEGDIILYLKDNGESVCHRVYQINSIGPIKKYHTIGDNNKLADRPIYESQINGKVVNVIDNNLWNIISMEIWDASIHNFNVNYLFTDP
jgi:signal peptidase I